MARRRHSKRRHRRGSSGFLYKLLSVLAICGAVVAALTLFFRVDTVVVTGMERYTEREVVDATGIESGDNLYLLNKNAVARNIQAQLPYIEKVQINRKLPDTLLIEVEECGTPFALIQDGSAWLVSPKGMIVEQRTAAGAADYAEIEGCELLAPSVGTKIALATEYTSQQTSLLDLMRALEEQGMLDQVDSISLEDTAILTMGYAQRFTVEMPYGADYSRKLRFLQGALESGAIQSNQKGTLEMTQEDGKILFIEE